MSKAAAHPDPLLALLRRAGAGDEAAFHALHCVAAKRLLAFAARIVTSKDAAEDVLQESFIAIWRDAARFDGARAAPMTWMMTIVRNKAIDWLRANALREGLAGGDGVEPPDPSAGPCEMAERDQRSRQVQAGLTLLAALPRQAIELAFFHEMTHQQVAAEMTIPLGTVKTWIRRGCRQMRPMVEGGLRPVQTGAPSWGRRA